MAFRQYVLEDFEMTALLHVLISVALFVAALSLPYLSARFLTAQTENNIYRAVGAFVSFLIGNAFFLFAIMSFDWSTEVLVRGFPSLHLIAIGVSFAFVLCGVGEGLTEHRRSEQEQHEGIYLGHLDG